MGVDVSELLALAADLDRVPERLAKPAQDALRAAAKEVQSTAKAAAPVRTGALRGSISIVPMATALAVTVTADEPYAAYVEFGTAKMPAEPFLLPAAEAAQDSLASRLESAAVAAIDG